MSDVTGSTSSTPTHWPRPTGQVHYFKLKPVRIRFLRGTRVCACQQPASGALVETRVAIPLHSKVVGNLFRYGRRPLDGELITIRIELSPAPSVDVDSGGEVTTLELESQAAGLVTKKKLLLWHGDSSDLGGAEWGDIILINVSASGDLPYQLYVT